MEPRPAPAPLLRELPAKGELRPRPPPASPVKPREASPKKKKIALQSSTARARLGSVLPDRSGRNSSPAARSTGMGIHKPPSCGDSSLRAPASPLHPPRDPAQVVPNKQTHTSSTSSPLATRSGAGGGRGSRGTAGPLCPARGGSRGPGRFRGGAGGTWARAG